MNPIGGGDRPHRGGDGPTGGGKEAFSPLTAVQFHMFLQVLLKVEGLPTGWFWAGEGLLMDVLVLLVVLGKDTA